MSRVLLYAMMLLMVIAGCQSIGLPNVTPTVAPTDTPTAEEVSELPSRTPIVTIIQPTSTPSVTLTPSVTATATHTLHPSETPTRTPTATKTATLTATFTPTYTPTPTPTIPATKTPTPVPTLTPLPIIARDTATLTPSATTTPSPTPSPTPTWSATPLPSATPVPPTRDPDEIARLLTATQETFNITLTALIPTQTALPTLPPLPPTLDVTPTFITATPGQATPILDLGIITPPTGDEPQEQSISTQTPTPAPTVDIVIPIPPTIARGQVPQIQTRGGVSFFAPLDFNVGGNSGPLMNGGLLVASYDAPLITGVNPRLIAANPVDPNQFVLVNDVGTLFTLNHGAGNRPSSFPFHPTEYRTLAENNIYVRDIAWSPDGRRYAFIVDGDLHSVGKGVDDDGVYFTDWASGQSTKLVHDCAYNEHRGCFFGGHREFFHQSIGLEWAPDSRTLLVTAQMTSWPGPDARQVLLVVPDYQDPAVQPTPLYFDYGSWAANGSQVIVSGLSMMQGINMIGIVNRDGGGLQILFDASDAGWWVQDAVQRPNGQVVALGRPGNQYGPMQIIDSSGTPLTAAIGWDRPTHVEWSPDRSAVLVFANGRRYIAYVDGRVDDITDSTANASAITWIGRTVSQPQVNQVQDGFIPTGVIEGSRFAPGQQVWVWVEYLNMRNEPNTNNTPIGSAYYGEWLAILAGPVRNEGVEWWYIQNAVGQSAWVAGEINGYSTLGESG